ncbi:MAG TPA: hypothetical protein VI408_01135, partial [Gaiellaceae bacterium]
MAAVAFGIIADARAIQRRRRAGIGGGLALLALAGGALAIASFRHHAAAHRVTVRIVLGRSHSVRPFGLPVLVTSGGSPLPFDAALRTIRREPGFTSLSGGPNVLPLHGAARARRLPVLVVYPVPAVVDAEFTTRLSPAKLARDLQAKLGAGA